MNGSSLVSSPASKLLDDLLRRELRVGDPRSATEVAEALRRRYVGEARRIDQEASGLPVLIESALVKTEAAPPRATTAGTKEETRVTADLEADLGQLIEAPANREWKPELQGWRSFLVPELAESAAAARFAQDPAQRQRGFLGVRRLNEYARVARLVSVVNRPKACDFRRLATTLDDAASTLRVLMGEALYDAGLSDGGVIVPIPVVELRDRRQAVLQALRRLIGSTSDSGEDWGFASASYEALLLKLDAQGWPELKVYLREEGMSVALDRLVTAASRRDPEALRQLASTHPIERLQLDKLLRVAIDLSGGKDFDFATDEAQESAALNSFVQTLTLFLSAFAATRSGARLIDLAVPLSLAASQTGEADGDARGILRALVSLRAEFGREVECFLRCCCGTPEESMLQVQLDKGLYDIDRCIDLFAQGEGYAPDWGDEEFRASGYIAVFTALIVKTNAHPPLKDPLTAVAAQLGGVGADNERRKLETNRVAAEQRTHEAMWRELVGTLAPRCSGDDALIRAGLELLSAEENVMKASVRESGDTRLRVRPLVASVTRIAEELKPDQPGGKPPAPPPPGGPFDLVERRRLAQALLDAGNSNDFVRIEAALNDVLASPQATDAEKDMVRALPGTADHDQATAIYLALMSSLFQPAH